MNMPDDIPSDLPRAELLVRAQEVATATELNGNCNVAIHFKFTCEKCAMRIMLQEPNTLYEYGECCICGHKTKIEKGGFTMVVKLDVGGEAGVT